MFAGIPSWARKKKKVEDKKKVATPSSPTNTDDSPDLLNPLNPGSTLNIFQSTYNSDSGSSPVSTPSCDTSSTTTDGGSCNSDGSGSF
jgi:hypothetical protein